MRVLVVDDSRTMRAALRAVIHAMGHGPIEEAESGEDAIVKLGAFDPELILTDWAMPGMDGLELVRHVRALELTTPMIMVSTEADPSRIAQALIAGVNCYVTKPFTPDVLSQRIEETLARVAA